MEAAWFSERWYPPIILRGVTTQKATISTSIAVETWKLVRVLFQLIFCNTCSQDACGCTIPAESLSTHSLGRLQLRWLLLFQMITDLLLLAGTNSAAKLHSKRGAQVYYYLFDYRGTNSFSSVATNSTADYGECLQYVEQANICNISQPSPVAWVRFGV
jgi:hypothetical protein